MVQVLIKVQSKDMSRMGAVRAQFEAPLGQHQLTWMLKRLKGTPTGREPENQELLCPHPSRD